MRTVADLLRPIRDRILEGILSARELFTDDTPVTIAKSRNAPGSKQGRVWNYLDREGRHAYDFTDSRRPDEPQAVHGDYKGAIHAEAYPGYDQLFLPEGATEVACWVRARRKFVEAESSEPELAKEAIDRIRELYAVEGIAKDRGLDDEGR